MYTDVKTWRFFFFEQENDYYCFDCITQKILLLTPELMRYLKDSNYKLIQKNYPTFNKQILLKEDLNNKSQQRANNKKCCVTINISNNCNLDCVYCYRNKQDKNSLDKESIKNILIYLITQYMPEAESYSLSLCNTSESSLELEKLIYIDSLIAEYEGYLFSKEKDNKYSLIQLYYRLPEIIREKIPLSNENCIYDVLNTILKKEKLWTIYDFSNNEYLVSVLEEGIELSLSRQVMANRIVLNTYFKELNIERNIKYISLWFMTNGTNITDKYINFIKSILMKEITVSIDGDAVAHNTYRKAKNGEGSFRQTLEGIKKLQENNISVIASVTITPKNPDFLKTLRFLYSIGIKSVKYNLVRGSKENCIFDETSMRVLLYSWEKIFNLLYEEICTARFKYVLMLKDSFVFSIFKCLFYRNFRIKRCGWADDLVIDSKGDMYHCNSTIGQKTDYLGNFRDGKSYLSIPYDERNVNTDFHCSSCFAKYLCGGTCYANEILGVDYNLEQECIFKKYLIKKSLMLYTQLHKHLDLKRFMQIIA